MVDVILGIEICRIYDGIVSFPISDVENILKGYNVYEERSVQTPIDLSLQLVKIML